MKIFNFWTVFCQIYWESVSNICSKLGSISTLLRSDFLHVPPYKQEILMGKIKLATYRQITDFEVKNGHFLPKKIRDLLTGSPWTYYIGGGHVSSLVCPFFSIESECVLGETDVSTSPFFGMLGVMVDLWLWGTLWVQLLGNESRFRACGCSSHWVDSLLLCLGGTEFWCIVAFIEWLASDSCLSHIGKLGIRYLTPFGVSSW